MSADSDSLTQSGLPVSVRVDLRLNQINTAVIRLGLAPGDTVAVGDPVSIELGDADQGTETVFTGVISEIRQQTAAYTLWCSSAMQALSQLRINKVYEQQKAGDIVSDLASLAEIDTDKVESGLTYPFYALGADRHLLSHLQMLARRDGFDLFANPDDALTFAPWASSQGQELRYGAEILDYNFEELAPTLDGVEVYGESPASLGEGDKAYSWLTKEEVKGNAGNSSGNILRVADPSIRNQDAAASAAEKLMNAFSTQKLGWVEAMGTPTVKLGGTVTLSELPEDSLNGDYKITGIRHLYDKMNGFVTTINWEEK
ncbi:MAG: hypothetical protein H6581_14065 [Bacteroidia bacterium]|nr:hypothetical protein [Bacteroidia bacterium]